MRILPALILLALVPAAEAHAAFFAGEPVDGPSEALAGARPDVDLAPDGGGVIAYVRGPQVVAARLVAGVPQPPVALGDGALPAAAASDGGRAVVVFAGGGRVLASVRPNAQSDWVAPQDLGPGTAPAVDISLNGVAYAAWTAGGDVRVARLDRGSSAFSVLPQPADLDPARAAGDGTGAPSIAVSADGTALVAFGEREGDRSRVIARRVFGLNLSSAPQVLDLDSLEGRPGGVADLPDAEIEDDSSFAWVTFRQVFADGTRPQARAVARRLRGSAFEEPALVDGLSWGDGRDALVPKIAMSGRGAGTALTSVTGGVVAAVLKDDRFFGGRTLAGGGPLSGDIAENLDRIVGWVQDGTVRARSYDDRADVRQEPVAGPEQALSDPAQGPVDADSGLDVSMDRAGGAALVFVQGRGADRRLMHATFDRPPGVLRGATSESWRRLRRPVLAWSEAFDLWGPVRYRVELDGAVLAEGLTEPRLVPPQDLPDGEHRWRVVASDRRGQTQAAPPRTVRVDTTPPELDVRITRSKRRLVRLVAGARDSAGSGVARVRVLWGDGAEARGQSSVSVRHRFRSSRTATLRISATDRAGNATVQRVRVKPRR